MKYAWIQSHRDSYAVAMMCAVLKVSTSGYYAWLQHKPSQTQQRRAVIAQAAEQAYCQSHRIYGYRKVHDDLQEQRIACCRETVRKVLGEKRLFSRTQRKFVVTTNSDHALPVAPNRLDRNFQASAPNQKWAADISYLPTEEGWLYLAVVIDLFSRRVIGWSMAASLQVHLVLDALKRALRCRGPDPGLMHHSDRGSQYASEAYQQILAQQAITCSMSGRGNCWDNATVESFFGKLKAEWTHHRTYATRKEAETDIFLYIELFYNRQRKHAALGYLSPAAFERLHQPSDQQHAA